MKRTLYRLVVLMALCLQTSLASACPVCFSAKNEANRDAFVITTALLTFLPLGLIGTGVWWFRRRLRQLEPDEPRRMRRRERARGSEPRHQPQLLSHDTSA